MAVLVKATKFVKISDFISSGCDRYPPKNHDQLSNQMLKGSYFIDITRPWGQKPQANTSLISFSLLQKKFKVEKVRIKLKVNSSKFFWSQDQNIMFFQITIEPWRDIYVDQLLSGLQKYATIFTQQKQYVQLENVMSDTGFVNCRAL